MRKNKVKFPENALILLVGAAGSGKSTFAEKVFNTPNAIIVSSDACRKEISGDENNQKVTKEAFELFYKKIENGIIDRKQVVADATNLDEFGRNELYQIAQRHDVPVYALIFNIPLEIIKRQNKARDRIVPEYVIDKHFLKMKKLYQQVENELPQGHVIDIVAISENIKKLDDYER